jgi:WD40-like Beta Propeller Repeat
MQPLPSPAKRCWIPLRNRGFRRLTTPSLPDVSRSFAGPSRGQSVDDVIHELVVGGLPPESGKAATPPIGTGGRDRTTDPSLKRRCDTGPLCGRRPQVRAGGRRRAASTLLTLGLAVSACGQAPTGGGGEIAFTSDADGDVDVYAMRADGSGVHQITDRAGEDSFPAWSPDRTSWPRFDRTRGYGSSGP